MTLIEIMIVVVIVGILAAIALPSYQNHVIRANRAAATACLTEMAQVMERRYSQDMRYNADTAAGLPASQCVTDLNARYGFQLQNLAGRTFTLQATPTSLQSDSTCGTLTLNQAGQKTANGSTAANIIRQCW